MPFGKRGSRCCCGGDCCEGCTNCTWSVVISGMMNSSCTSCSNIDGTYAVSTVYGCSDSLPGNLSSADFECFDHGDCGCVWADSFSVSPSACSSSTTVYIGVYLCCEEITVVVEIQGDKVTNDTHRFSLTKTQGAYSGCNISGLGIPWESQQGDFSGLNCQSKLLVSPFTTATCTLTSSC